MKDQNGFEDSSLEAQAQRTAYLIAGYLRQTLTDKEHDELDDWVSANEENMILFERLTDKKEIEEGLREMKGYDTRKAVARIREKIKTTAEKPQKRKRNYWPYSIAASVLLIGGILFLKNYDRKAQGPVVEKQDLHPGANKAILTFSDGSTMNLTDAGKGVVRTENGTRINKTGDGELSYTPASGDQLSGFNLLVTPRGGQYLVLLADGTKVWLNAASSLRYPTTFNSKERLVELTGEGYFEVAKNVSKPFKVKLQNGMFVEVTGTHFNINSYPDEDALQVTLLEGGVQIKDAGEEILQAIAPGEKAIIADRTVSIDRNANTDEVIAWKNGMFKFKDQSIETIMRAVGRWYDVEIVYEGKVTEHFNITGISKNVMVSQLFKLLEMTGRVHFTVVGKKIIVKP